MVLESKSHRNTPKKQTGHAKFNDSIYSNTKFHKIRGFPFLNLL